MTASGIMVWVISILLLFAITFRIISKRIARQKEWNTDRREDERRADHRRSQERRRMVRPPPPPEETSAERRQNERRADERRNPEDVEEAYKKLVKNVDEEGFTNDN